MGKVFLVLVAVILFIGCGGPSAEQWQASQQTIAKLKADLDAARKRHDEDERKYSEAMTDIDGLKTKLATVIEGYDAATTERQREVDTLSRYHQANAAPPPADPRGWHQILADTPRGENHCRALFSTTFEPGPAFAHVSVRRAFIRQTYDSRASCPKEKWRMQTIQWDFDCGARTMTPLAGTSLDWNDNQVSSDFSDAADAPTQVFPDTYGEAEWRYVCGKR